MYTMITGKVRYHIVVITINYLAYSIHVSTSKFLLECFFAGSWPQCGFKCCQCCRRMRNLQLPVHVFACNAVGGIKLERMWGLDFFMVSVSHSWWFYYYYVMESCFNCSPWELMCRFQTCIFNLLKLYLKIFSLILSCLGISPICALILCCFEIPFSKLSFVAFFLGVKLFYGCYYESFSQEPRLRDRSSKGNYLKITRSWLMGHWESALI